MTTSRLSSALTSRRARRRQWLRALVVSLVAFFLLVAASAVAAPRSKDLQKAWLAQAWRFQTVRCALDAEDLAAFSTRLDSVPPPTDRNGYTDHLCLQLLVRRALAGYETFHKTRDPGVGVPTGDLLERAVRMAQRNGPDRPMPEAVVLALGELADRVEHAQPDGPDATRHMAIAAARRVRHQKRQCLFQIDLLCRHLPERRRAPWTAMSQRLGRALDVFANACADLGKRLPEPTDFQKREAARRDIEHTLRYGYLYDGDSRSLLRDGAAFFLDTLACLEARASRIDPGASWQELLRKAEEHHPAPGGIVTSAKEAAREALRFVIEHRLVSVPEKARHIEVVPGRPGGPPFAYYRPARGGMAGAFVAMPLNDKMTPEERKDHLRANHRDWMRCVALHEAVPGHHLQFTVAASIDSPLRRRLYAPSYVEGWGLYCEQMMADKGYHTPVGRLTQLRMKLWRAARVMLSLSMNHQGLTQDRAKAFLCEKVMFKPAHASREAAMYRRRPAYFTAYAIGFKQIERLRERMREMWGPGYSDRRFHDTLLSFGPLPIPLIEKVLVREARQAAYGR